MKKIELLSPVGGYEQFIAAVESGADAVYLGGTSFNARNSANNFSDEELKEVINYAHLRDVKVHLTLNTLIHDREINDVIEFAKRVYSYGIDAFIVQDLGVIKLLREVIPDATIHFSTQGTMYSLDGVNAVKDFNFERVVLSRELTLNEIEEICKNTDTEIEVFVHGALCICYSGQCRLSSLVGERSGNRGKCAQPCRLQYSLYKEDEKIIKNYTLSPKDLCGIHDLVRLIKIGVSSLKIEGRLKSPEYVACVTSIYRKYIDLAYELIEKGEEDKYEVSLNDIEKMAQVFNRGGFSKGYYNGKLGKELICRDRPKHSGTYLGKVIDYDRKRKLVKAKLDNNLNMGDGIEIVNENLPGNIVTYLEKNGVQVKKAESGEVISFGDISGIVNKGDKIYKISDKILNTELRTILDGKYHKKVDIDMEFSCEVGKNLTLKISDDNGNIVESISEYIPILAINKPLTLENAKNSLSKLGDTPFRLREFKANIVGNSLVPMSVLNELRRDTISKLSSEKTKIKIGSIKEKEEINIFKKEVISKISVYLYDVSNLEGLELADRIYVPIDKFCKEVKEKLDGKEVIPYLSTITKNEKFNFNDIDSILIGNLEHFELCKEVKNIYCDFSLNVFNSYACKKLKELGAKGVNYSFELNLEEMKRIKTDLENEVTIYGRLPLMVSEHCPIGSEIKGHINCGLCEKNQYYLEDRTNVKFPIITDRKVCRSTILNGKILFTPEVVEELEGEVDYFRAYFYDESTDERRRILDVIKNGKKVSLNGYTSGHFYRGV